MVLAELLPNVNELFEWKGIVGRAHAGTSSTRSALMALVSTVICIVLFWYRRHAPQARAVGHAERGRDGLRLAIEENVSLAAMGEEGKKWTPFFATLFFWIFFINIWSVIPFIQFPATSRLAIPLFLALVSWLHLHRRPAS